MPSFDDEYGEDVATAAVPDRGAGNESLTLRALGERFSGSFPLPRSGVVVLGRSDHADIRLEDHSVSRRHAALHLGPDLEIEDLGAANGTHVGGGRLAPRARQTLAIGDVIELGSVMLVVQRALVSGRRWRLWSHEYFEARLDEECSRPGRGQRAFSILHLSVRGPGVTVAQEALAEGLREQDVAAAYAPDEYEALLIDRNAEEAASVLQALVARLRERGAEARGTVASYPRDGRTAHALVAAIGHAVRGSTAEPTEPAVVVADGAMEKLHRLLDRLAAGNISVLLLGETGVGKEVLAETLHRRSPRADKPLLRLHCAALSESLLESELFGHEKGAFTGAVTAKEGLLESADGGSVFLDEVGELPLALQVKLLRVLDDRRITRVGAVKSRTIDVRFISATNRDLEQEVARGTFRQDLYYRLSGMSLLVPPLRERTTEIDALARMFMSRTCQQLKRAPLTLSAALLDELHRYAWPGNIRELRNVIERAVLLCSDDELRPEHVVLDKRGSTVLVDAGGPDDAHALERRRVLDALDRCAGNQTQAAKLLGISRGTLVARLDEYGLPRPRKKST